MIGIPVAGNISKDDKGDGEVAPLLVVEEMSCHIQGRTLIHGVSLRLLPGEMVVLAGPNGAGKSTLLSALHGGAEWKSRVKTTVGRFELNVEANGQGKNALPAIVIVPQRHNTFRDLTVQENLAIGASRLDAGHATAVLAKVLSLAPALIAKERWLVRRLSGGEEQLLAVCIGLVQQPALLLLDEPTRGLDAPAAGAVLDLLHGVRNESKQTCLIVEHRLASFSSVADRLIGLRGGQIVYDAKWPAGGLSAEILDTIYG